MMKIDDFKADDQDTLEEKTKQNQQDVKLSTSINDANMDENEVDGKSPHKKNFFRILPSRGSSVRRPVSENPHRR